MLPTPWGLWVCVVSADSEWPLAVFLSLSGDKHTEKKEDDVGRASTIKFKTERYKNGLEQKRRPDKKDGQALPRGPRPGTSPFENQPCGS
jgi:hypothetical protein